MIFRKVFLTAVAGILACSLSPAPAGALENIVIAYPTTSSQFTPLWFARDVGLYEKYGLDGKLVFIQGGSILLQAMLAGQAQAAQNGIAETAVAILRRRCADIGRHSEDFPLHVDRCQGCQKRQRSCRRQARGQSARRRKRHWIANRVAQVGAQSR